MPSPPGFSQGQQVVLSLLSQSSPAVSLSLAAVPCPASSVQQPVGCKNWAVLPSSSSLEEQEGNAGLPSVTQGAELSELRG